MESSQVTLKECSGPSTDKHVEENPTLYTRNLSDRKLLLLTSRRADHQAHGFLEFTDRDSWKDYSLCKRQLFRGRFTFSIS